MKVETVSFQTHSRKFRQARSRINILFLTYDNLKSVSLQTGRNYLINGVELPDRFNWGPNSNLRDDARTWLVEANLKDEEAQAIIKEVSKALFGKHFLPVTFLKDEA